MLWNVHLVPVIAYAIAAIKDRSPHYLISLVFVSGRYHDKNAQLVNHKELSPLSGRLSQVGKPTAMKS